jgi:hypothetical protein
MLAKPIDKKQQKKITVFSLLLIAGAVYLFLVYLPIQKQKRELEAQIQDDLDKLSSAKPEDYSMLLTTLQNYLQLTNGLE